MQIRYQTLIQALGLSLLVLFGVESNFTSTALAGCKDSAEPGVSWVDCRKRNLILSESDLRKSDLSGADFSSTDLRNSNFTGASLYKTNLMRSTMAGSKAAGANFEYVQSYRTNFANTDFTDANFSKAELQRSNFSGANLSGVNFSKADLGRANFDNAILKDNNFERANLSRVDFSKAKLSGKFNVKNAYLLQTNIEDRDMSKTTGLEQWQVDIACGNDQTILPAGLNHPENWPCVADPDE